MTRTLILPLLALALAPVASAAADAPPKVEVVAPDEATGLWLAARDRSGRLFLRYCTPDQPARCSPWAAADLGWGDRVETDDANVRPSALGNLPFGARD
ncbi:hypothetical protein [Albimonas pacifica]|uniref:Secreted protein n=1 Tax=Albimonas pacifica TaxID=1114924 RepID=A0A1I3QEN1_9RHOB|nr:hypothetical protein [Albimonas pacifica]SFJ31576.1 hypothetical protein SAMN05216258_1364 [Albimonas pacifica]